MIGRWLVRLGQGFSEFTGQQALIPMPKYEECNIVIICSNNGSGLRPWRLFLPHQFYESCLQELLDERPDTRWITVVPARSADYVDIWRSQTVDIPVTSLAQPPDPVAPSTTVSKPEKEGL
jgi:hypothetical protein